nr:hypothetical protein [uncultured Anaeromusa sp.]
MRKFMTLAAIVLLVFVLAGCGGTDKTSTSSSSAPTAKQESATDLLAKGKNLPGLTYDYTMKAKEGPAMTGKVWLSGKKMKTEAIMENQKIITYLDGDANVIYNYMPSQARIMKIPFDPNRAAKSPDQYSKETDAANVKILETVNYDGVSCKVVLREEKSGQSQVKMWVREDYGIPAKVEVMEAGVLQMTAEYKNIKVGSVPPETFALPQGIQVIDMSEMMKQIPAKP